MSISPRKPLYLRATTLLAVLVLANTVAPAVGRLVANSTETAKTIIDFQPFRKAESIRIAAGGRTGMATLVNLNPAINAWYVLTVAWDGMPARSYHLESPAPQTRRLVLDQQHPSGLFIHDAGNRSCCELFTDPASAILEQGRRSGHAYYPVCDGRLYLRNTVVGHRTRLEAATAFVRDHLWGGESVIDFGHQVMSDANRVVAVVQSDGETAASARAQTAGPLPAMIDPAYADRVVAAPGLGITVSGATAGRLAPGAWYATSTPGAYVSVVQPNFAAPQPGRGRQAAAIDGTESASLCYLVAFDLDRYRLAWARGTTHPTLGWSAHMPDRMRTPGLAGPDGFDAGGPLAATGLVPPQDRRRTIAAFTAGFKREHGAFLYGELSQKNAASHYGFIENGVVFSRLQPELATIFTLDDGTVGMKTWAERDDALLPRIRFARQNGVALVEPDPSTQMPGPGRFVTQWGAGNWSGSADRKLRTMRSGAALQRWNGRRYLIYAVFSSATPSGMVRVFLAYRCDYAMLLDMNALEHTYLGFYRMDGARRITEYLMSGMREVDVTAAGRGPTLARFVDYADNRDFFYVVPRDEKGAAR